MNTVLVVGAFDLLHAGHAKFLAEARSFGDNLTVGVASDACRRRDKGEGHPLVGERDRSDLLKLLKPVSQVEIVEEDNIISLLRKVKPAVFYTLEKKFPRGREGKLVRSLGGKVVLAKKELPYLSSSEMVDRVADLKIKQVIEYFIGKIDPKPYSGKLTRAQYINPMYRESVLSVGRPNIPSNLLSLIYFGKVVKPNELAYLSRSLKNQGKRVVFTAMGGDLLHVGHARFLKKAAALGDTLVVGIPSNQSMRRQKGVGRPIVDEAGRAELLCYLKGVDYVVIFNEDTVLKTLEGLKPDIFQTVDDIWNKDYKKSPEYKVVARYGGKVVLCPKQAEGLSATQLINKAAKIRLERMFHDCLN